MANYNKVILAGRLTRDPQLSYTPSGTPVCEFGLATNHNWKDRDGNRREETCFVEAKVFARAAEVFNQYMAKGREVLIDGRLTFDQWTTPEGEKRSRHRVIVDNFQFLGGRPSEPGAPAQGYSQPSGAPPPQPSAPPPPEPGPPMNGTPAYGDPAPPVSGTPEYGDSAPPPPSEGDVPF